jgi:hypothetical protein
VSTSEALDLIGFFVRDRPADTAFQLQVNLATQSRGDPQFLWISVWVTFESAPASLAGAPHP